MGRIRKDSHSMIYHEASAKDISPCRANGPQEMAHGIRRKTSIKGKGASGLLQPQQSLCQGHAPLSGGRERASIDNGISVQIFPTTSEGIQPNKNDRG
ncbi:hypothetical protein Tco_1468295 [Tanacetum coccineum]